MISFADWGPDTADLDPTHARTVTNVLPGKGYYAPAQALSAISTALAAQCIGAFMMRAPDGTLCVFAGTSTKLYKYSAGSWTNVSGALTFNVPGGQFWSFCAFGNICLATNANDGVLFINATAGASFAAVAGSPSAKHISNVGDFVVAYGITNSLNSVIWSAINDYTGWTDGVNSSGRQDFPDGGEVVGCNGQENGIVIQTDAVRLMTFTPTSDAVFTFEKIEAARGSLSPFSTITVGSVIFYYGLDGFYAVAGTQSKNIGLDIVNNFFADDLDPASVTTIVGATDPRETRVLWAYKSVNGSTAPFDRIIGYDVNRNRWFLTVQDMEYLFGAASSGYTLEGLDAFGTVDSLTTSFDSVSWQGGQPALAAIDTTHKLAFFNGSNLEATLETAENQLSPPQRAYVSEVMPYVDSSSAVISVGTRETQQGSVAYSSERAIESSTGRCSHRSGARYHRFKLRIPAGATWSKALGVDATFVPDGDR